MALLLRRGLRLLHLSARSLIWLSLLLMVLMALAAASFRFYVLPQLDHYRQTLAEQLGSGLGRTVKIGSLDGQWGATHITFNLHHLAVLDLHGNPALRIDRAVGQLSWWSLLRRDLLFRDLQVDGGLLRLGRDARGTLWLGDLPLGRGGNSYEIPDWLLRQGRIRLQGGELIWQDARCPGQLRVSDITGLFDGGFFVNELELSARPGRQAAWRLTADWRGESLQQFEHWRGSAKLSLPLTEASGVLPWLLIDAPLTGGLLEGSISLQFAGATITRMTGEGGARVLHYVPANTARRVAVRDVFLRFELGPWQGSGQRLRFERLGLRLPGQHAGIRLDGLQLALRRQTPSAPARGEVQVPQLDLAWLSVLNPLLQRPLPDVDAMAAAGTVSGLIYRWQGPWHTPRGVELRADLKGASWQAHSAIPGASGVDARLTLKDGVGDLTFAASAGQALVLNMPSLFEQPLSWQRFDGQLAWRPESGGLGFTLSRLRLGNGDVAGQAQGRYLWHADHPAHITLDADLGPVDARAVGAYLPRILGEQTRSWLRQAFGAGRLSHTKLQLHGPLDRFPFAGTTEGLFRVSSHVQGVDLNYGPGWPAIKAIDGLMVFEGRSLRIDARSASILGTQVKSARVTIAALDAPEPMLDVKGRVEGATRDFLTFVQQSPLQKSLGALVGMLDVVGAGLLDLELDVPLADVDATRVRGRYRFAGNTLLPKGPLPRVDGLTGAFDFTGQGIVLQQAKGSALGGELSLAARTRSDGVSEIEINGRADARQAAQFYGLPLAEKASGSADYRVQLADEKAGLTVQVQSTLEGVVLDMPSPWGKMAAQGRPFKLSMQPGGNGLQQWSLGWQPILGMRLLQADTATGGSVVRGQINLGSAQIPPASRDGLWLTGRIGEVRVEDWLGLAHGGAPSLLGLHGVALALDGIEWEGRRWPAMSIDMRRDGTRWHGRVQSPRAQGTVTVDLSGAGWIKARLDSLNVPARSAEAAVRPAQKAGGSEGLVSNPPAWPAVDITVERLKLEGRDLGRLSLDGSPLSDGYALSAIALDNSDGKISAAAAWHRDGTRWRGSLQFDLSALDMGSWLTRWGRGDLVARGKGSVTARLDWRDSGVLPSLQEVDGEIRLQGNKGTLLKVNPGIGRLLGLLNIESILRRVRLDFKDVLSQGLAFDTLSATARLQKGRLNIDPLKMQGPAVDVAVEGHALLGSGALELKLHVVPRVSGGVAVAGALVNPAVGLSLLLLQQVFSNPVGKMLTYTYNVGGTWDKPDVRSQEDVPTAGP